MRILEKTLVKFEEAPLDSIYRLVIGFVFIPGASRLPIEGLTLPLLFLLLLSLLFLLRAIPAVLRHVFPFSPEIQQIWHERRQLAKRNDSYQWRKLFWIGIGMAIYVGAFGDFRNPPFIVAVACILAGGIGLVVWTSRSRSTKKAPVVSTGPERSSV